MKLKLTLEKEDGDENKPVYARGFHFASRDTIECMVGFRMYSHTIKRRTLKQLLLCSGIR
jgi:hypothetical protein